MTPIKDLRGMEMGKGKNIGLRCKFGPGGFVIVFSPWKGNHD